MIWNLCNWSIHYWQFPIVWFAEEVIEFVKELQDLYVTKLPSSETFECELNKPNVQVTWYRKDQPIKRSHKYDVIAEGRTHQLVVKDVEGKDEGEYSIIAKNARCEAKMTIHCKLLIQHYDVVKWKHCPRYRWIPPTKASDVEFWNFLWSVPK